MKVNFTNLIEKTIIDLLGEKSGTKFAKIYKAYWNPINFAVVTAIGIMLYYVLQPIFSGLIGNLLSLLVAFLWTWIMTVGPLGHWWGFETKKQAHPQTTKPKNKTNSSDWHKCQKKSIEVEYRIVDPDENGIETLEGYKPCNPKEHFIIRGVNGELYPIRKDIFKKTYKVNPEQKT